MSANVGDLIVSGAYETGLLTRRSVDGLLSVKDIAKKIEDGLGDTTQRGSVFLVTVLADDSGSIFSKGDNAALVAQGHNDIIDELRQITDGTTSEGVLIHTRYLNGQVLYPYTSLDRAMQMDWRTYKDGGGTPLYDQSIVTLATVIAKTSQLTKASTQVRTFTLIITDGADRHSRAANARSVAWLTGDMSLTGSHIVAAMGVSDGETKFRPIFREMGIKPGWILTPDDSRDAIRKAFQEVTEQLALAVGDAAGFTELALGPGPWGT